MVGIEDLCSLSWWYAVKIRSNLKQKENNNNNNKDGLGIKNLTLYNSFMLFGTQFMIWELQSTLFPKTPWFEGISFCSIFIYHHFISFNTEKIFCAEKGYCGSRRCWCFRIRWLDQGKGWPYQLYLFHKFRLLIVHSFLILMRLIN